MQFDNLTEDQSKQTLREISSLANEGKIDEIKKVLIQKMTSEDIGIKTYPTHSVHGVREFDQKFRYLCGKTKSVAGYLYMALDERTGETRTFVGGVGKTSYLLNIMLELLKEEDAKARALKKKEEDSAEESKDERVQS